MYDWQKSSCDKTRQAEFAATCEERCNPDASDLVVNTAAMEQARQNTAFAGARVKLLRKTSVEGAATFDDESIDWIFIDGDHTYDGCLADLKAWYPKIRKGGLISGDDYGDGFSTEHMPIERFESEFGHGHSRPGYIYGVATAVHAFTSQRQLQPLITYSGDCRKNPSWYFIKEV